MNPPARAECFVEDAWVLLLCRCFEAGGFHGKTGTRRCPFRAGRRPADPRRVPLRPPLMKGIVGAAENHATHLKFFPRGGIPPSGPAGSVRGSRLRKPLA